MYLFRGGVQTDNTIDHTSNEFKVTILEIKFRFYNDFIYFDVIGHPRYSADQAFVCLIINYRRNEKLLTV